MPVDDLVPHLPRGRKTLCSDKTMAKQDTTRVTKILKLWETPRNRKEEFYTLWEDLARIFLPRQLGFTSTQVQGARRTDDLFDSVPMQAARGLINNVGFFLRPDNQDWIRMRVENDQINNSEEAKLWLALAREHLIGALKNPKARFRQATGEVDSDLVVFGTGVGFIGESAGMNSLLFQSLSLKDATVLYSDEGIANGLFREMTRTIRQVAAMFPVALLSRKTKEKIQNNQQDDKIKILQVVLPRTENASENALLSINLPYSNVWIEVDEKHIIAEDGFHEFPFVAPRWDTTSGEDYGRGPAMVALPDGETLQAMEETILVSGQRAADPPLAAPNDGSFSAVNTFPGGLVYYDVDTASAIGGNPFFPLPSGVNLPITRDMQTDKREQVFSAFFRNILNLPVNGPEMTATEIIERKQEFIRELGPVFGRLETDYTGPMIERAFSIMLRAGALPPIPELLQGQNVTFEYESPITRIRQQIQAEEAKQWALEMSQAAQINPDVLDIVNFDGLARFTADAASVPSQVVNSEQAVQATRQAKAQAMAQQQQAQAMEQTAGTAEKMASAANKAGLTPSPEAEVPEAA